MRDTERREELLVAELAAEWLQRLKNGGPDVHAAFGRWLHESPQHVREVLLATAYEHVLRHVRQHRTIDLNALKEQHRLEARFSVPEWSVEASADSTKQSRSRLLGLTAALTSVIERSRWTLAAAVLCLAIAYVTAIAIQNVANRTISTLPSEWHKERLADGTVLQVGPLTRVSVDITGHQRVLRLARGEVMVSVAKDAARPFLVYTDLVIARAVGTAFAVQQTNPSSVSITVREGLVGVTRTTLGMEPGVVADPGEAIVLKAGERTQVVSDDAPLRAEPVDVERELAWVQGKLYLDHTVAWAIGEMNRRNHAQIRLADPAISQRRITGIVDAADPLAFARMLESALPVTLVDSGRGTLLLVPNPKVGPQPPPVH